MRKVVTHSGEGPEVACMTCYLVSSPHDTCGPIQSAIATMVWDTLILEGQAEARSKGDMCIPCHRKHLQCVNASTYGRRMQRFLQFRLGCHGLPVAIGRLAGAGHVDRANRVCLACKSGAIGDEKHMIFECAAMALLRQQHADLFTPQTDAMRSFFAQQDHLGVLNYVS